MIRPATRPATRPVICSMLAISCAVSGAFSPVFAGSILEVVTTEYREEPPVIGTVEISTQDGLSRMEITSVSSSESGAMIYREQSGELIAIDHEKKEYYVMDKASMEQIATQLSSAMQQMQQALAEMPPEQRAMAEQMMKQHIPAPAQEPEPMTVRKTGSRDSINGFGCDYYEVQQQGAKIRELCVTAWDDIDGGREAADSMLAMADFFDNMAEQFSAGTGMDVMGQQRELFEHMRELDGYPVLTREFGETGRVESESRLKSAGTRDIDADFFSPPTGYTQMDLGL
ncbi:MAG: DUF4412 domain-containing protein [Woeseia sp.]